MGRRERAWPVSVINFFWAEMTTSCSVEQKVDTSMGQAAYHAPNQTSGHGPPTALQVANDDSLLSGTHTLRAL